jgi:hypothetical protein
MWRSLRLWAANGAVSPAPGSASACRSMSRLLRRSGSGGRSRRVPPPRRPLAGAWLAAPATRELIGLYALLQDLTHCVPQWRETDCQRRRPTWQALRADCRLAPWAGRESRRWRRCAVHLVWQYAMPGACATDRDWTRDLSSGGRRFWTTRAWPVGSRLTGHVGGVPGPWRALRVVACRPIDSGLSPGPLVGDTGSLGRRTRNRAQSSRSGKRHAVERGRRRLNDPQPTGPARQFLRYRAALAQHRHAACRRGPRRAPRQVAEGTAVATLPGRTPPVLQGPRRTRVHALRVRGSLVRLFPRESDARAGHRPQSVSA